MKRGASGNRNDLAELFRPEVGETKVQIIGRLEAMLWQVREWVKEGYEHASENCTKAVELMDGEMRGGWISPKTWTCSLCGFYAGSIKEDVLQLEISIEKLKEASDDYRYGLGKPYA